MYFPRHWLTHQIQSKLFKNAFLNGLWQLGFSLQTKYRNLKTFEKFLISENSLSDMKKWAEILNESDAKSFSKHYCYNDIWWFLDKQVFFYKHLGLFAYKRNRLNALQYMSCKTSPSSSNLRYVTLCLKCCWITLF